MNAAKKIFFMMLVVLILSVSSCRTAPIVRVSENNLSFIDHAIAQQDLGRIIILSGKELGWLMDREETGVIIATLLIQSHMAKAKITYDTDGFKIIYMDSSNLKYDGDKIHKSYNAWIRNLDSTIRENLELTENSQKILELDKDVYISRPEDGSYGDRLYYNSGKATANALKAEFDKYTPSVHIATNCHGENCFDQIDSDKYTYYVWPEILHWEDRTTKWSGTPDRVAIKIRIFNVKTKEEILTVSLKGRSTRVTLGDNLPQNLLSKPISNYLKTIY